MERSFGTSLPKLGPGLSARIRLALEPPLRGTIARRNTITPIPPTQCVKLLQKREVWESASTSLKIQAPVVVNPDMVSNSASAKEGISFVSTKGIHPNILIIIQLNAVMTHPSFR